MHLVQLFLPLRDNEGSAFPGALYEGVRADLAEMFGGVTAFTRGSSHASGPTKTDLRAR